MKRDNEPTVFVVDDDQAMRKSLQWLIESVALSVETFATAQQFLDAYDPSRPGCLVLDVRMPGMSGLDLQERLAAGGVTLPVIIITGHADVSSAIRALKAGAVDFIEKPCNGQVLLDRIQAALAKDAQLRQDQSAHSDLERRLSLLTPREREVMDLVVEGLPNKAIAVSLNVSPKTIETHRAKVMAKMGAASLADLVRAAMAIVSALPAGKP